MVSRDYWVFKEVASILGIKNAASCKVTRHVLPSVGGGHVTTDDLLAYLGTSKKKPAPGLAGALKQRQQQQEQQQRDSEEEERREGEEKGTKASAQATKPAKKKSRLAKDDDAAQLSPTINMSEAESIEDGAGGTDGGGGGGGKDTNKEAISQELEEHWRQIVRTKQDPEKSLEQERKISDEINQLCNHERLMNKKAIAENEGKEELAALQAAEDQIKEAMEAIRKGSVAVSFVGDKRAGKSFCINHLLRRMLGLDESLTEQERGKIPLPSVSGVMDGSPWPLIIQLTSSVTRIELVQEMCQQREYNLRVELENQRHERDKGLEYYGCVESQGKIKLDSESEVGRMMALRFTESPVKTRYVSTRNGQDMGADLRDVAKELRTMRGEEREDLCTNKLILRIPYHHDEIELRDLPGLGHTSWRIKRDMNASHGTDIVCFMTDGRWPEPTRLDQLADYEIFSEKTFEEPPQLLIAYNITKDEKNRTAAPDAVLEGDDDDPTPFVKVIKSKVSDALRSTTKLEQGIMWSQIADDIRQPLLESVRENLEVLPFYPEPVRTTSGAPYDFVTLLSALVSSKQVKKMRQLHSKVIRSARTWLFYAVCAIKWIKEPFLTTEDKKFWTQLKKSYKAKEKDLEDFTNEVKTDLLPALEQQLVCNGEALQTICSRIEPAINTALQHVPLGAEMAAKDLKRHIFSTLQVMIETQVRKEIEAWIRRTLKGLEPLRKVITGKIHRLINALYPKRASAPSEGLWSTYFSTMEQLPKRDHEIFQQIEEWVTGVAPKSTFPKSLEANVSTAYKAAVTLALPKNRGTIEEEDVHQVIADTVRLTLKGTSKSSKSIEKLLRQLLIGPSRESMPNYKRELDMIIEALSLPSQKRQLAKRQNVEEPSAEGHLRQLRQLLQKHGGAASYGRSQAFYRPATLKGVLARLPSRQPQVFSRRAGSMARCQKQADPTKLQQHFNKTLAGGTSAQKPEIIVPDPERRDSIILATVEHNDDDTDPYYTFKVPKRLLLHLTEQDQQEHYSVPLFVVNMTIAAVLELRNAIERLDKLGEPQVKYLMFVTVADEEFHQAVKIFNANSVSKGSLLYLIALPKFSSEGQTKREAVEVAKQLAEGLADQPTITLELYYMLLSQVEFVRQYHTHECQMVPTTFFRAFTEGVKVYNHLRSGYQHELTDFLKSNFKTIYKLCRKDKRDECFDLRDQMDSSSTSGPDPQTLDRIMALLPTDDELTSDDDGGGDDDDMKKQVAALRHQLQMHSGAYKIGPIFFSNTHNGDSRWNYASAGTYFPTRSAATDFVLCNTMAMRPFRTLNVNSKRQKHAGLAYLSQEMWKAGCPAVLVFNFEYYDKAPGSSEALLSEAPDSLVALQRQVFVSGGIGGDQELLRALLLSKNLTLLEEVQSGAAAEDNGLFRSLASQLGDADQHGQVQSTLLQFMRQNKHTLLDCVWSLSAEPNDMYAKEAAEELYDQLLERAYKTGVLECVLTLHIFTLAYKCQLRIFWVNELGCLGSYTLTGGRERKAEGRPKKKSAVVIDADEVEGESSSSSSSSQTNDGALLHIALLKRADDNSKLQYLSVEQFFVKFHPRSSSMSDAERDNDTQPDS